MPRLLNTLLLIMPFMLSAQTYQSPVVHADRTVTFTYHNPAAKRVKLRSDCLYPQPDNSTWGEKTRTVRMQRDSLGTWTYTTDPLLPELYFYNFIVDGKRIPDPLNPDSTYILLHQSSTFVVGGSPSANLFLPVPDSAGGHLDYLSYHSNAQDINRRVVVYTPHDYTEPLPVLYLLHGISGDEERWIDHGHAKHILDNMIAQGRCQPMIVVMPDCNVVRRIQRGKRTNLLRNMLNYPALCKGDFEAAFYELQAFIASHYIVSDAPHHTAIAGLSSGARQAANIAILQPDTFSVIGLFSPVVHKKQLPKGTHSSPSAAEWYADSLSAEIVGNASVRCNLMPTSYAIYVGTNDLFYRNARRCHRRLHDRHIPCTLHETTGGHTWHNWRLFLIDFLPTLFHANQ